MSKKSKARAVKARARAIARSREWREAETAKATVAHASPTLDREAHKESNTRRPRQLGLLVWFLAPVKRVWAVALGAIALLQFAWDLAPDLEISAELGGSDDPLATYFRVTNVGRMHVNNLRFGCKIDARGTGKFATIESVVMVGGDLQLTGEIPANRLDPGESVTRDCVVRSRNALAIVPNTNPAAMRVDVYVLFDWPYAGFHARVDRWFSTRMVPGTKKYVFVPDL